MKGVDIVFKNRPNDDGTVSTFTIKDCLVAPKGSPDDRKPKLTVHLPKDNAANVKGSWFEYDGHDYHVTGVSPVLIAENTPGRWNRYVVAEKPF